MSFYVITSRLFRQKTHRKKAANNKLKDLNLKQFFIDYFFVVMMLLVDKVLICSSFPERLEPPVHDGERGDGRIVTSICGKDRKRFADVQKDVTLTRKTTRVVFVVNLKSERYENEILQPGARPISTQSSQTTTRESQRARFFKRRSAGF